MEESLKDKWEQTSQDLNLYEQKLIDCYLQFLRDIAAFFIKQGNMVLFRENSVAHWGEGGFGHLYIVGTEEDESLLPGYFLEIQIVGSPGEIRGSYKEITLQNLNEITYEIDEWL